MCDEYKFLSLMLSTTDMTRGQVHDKAYAGRQACAIRKPMKRLGSSHNSTIYVHYSTIYANYSIIP